MKSIINIILAVAIFSVSPAYALNESDSAYINGVTFYNIFLASKPVLVEEPDYQEIYFDVLSHPRSRGENLPGRVSWNLRVNKTKADEIMNLTLKDDKAIEGDPRKFRFKDQPDYYYIIDPYGILAIYTIPEGNRLTINEFHQKKIKFLNETTERLKELRIVWEFYLGYDYKLEYYNISSGIPYTHIVKLTNKSNETYRNLMIRDYNITKVPQRNATILSPKGENIGRILDIVSIGGSSRSPYYLLYWYEFKSYSDYNKNEINEIIDELDEVSADLDNIRGNLSGDLNSTEIFSILESVSMFKNGTVGQRLVELHQDINSVDAFVKISEEIKNRQRAKWVDVLFGFIIDGNRKRSKQVNGLNDKYNTLEIERRDLFDVSVAIYSAALQREVVSEQLNLAAQNNRDQIRNSWLIAIVAIILGTVVSNFIMWYFQNNESKKLHELTESQINSNKESMERLIAEIKKLKSEDRNKLHELTELHINSNKESMERLIAEIRKLKSEDRNKE